MLGVTKKKVWKPVKMHFSLSGGLSGNFDQWKLNAEWRMFKWLLRLTCKGKGVKFSVHDGAMLPFGAFPIKLICDDLLLFWKVFMALSWAETQPRWSFCGAVTCLLMANCCQHTASHLLPLKSLCCRTKSNSRKSWRGLCVQVPLIRWILVSFCSLNVSFSDGFAFSCFRSCVKLLLVKSNIFCFLLLYIIKKQGTLTERSIGIGKSL